MEPTKFAPSLSGLLSLSRLNVRDVAMSPSSLLDRLGDDADVGDAGLLDGIHDGGEGAKGDALVGSEVNDALGGVGFAGGSEERWKLIDVDGLVLQEDVLLAVDGDDHALFGELIDGARLGDRDLDSGLENRCSEHEDEQKHKNDVDQRRDVDLGKRGLGTSFCREGHC